MPSKAQDQPFSAVDTQPAQPSHGTETQKLAEEKPSKDEDDGDGLFGPIRLGPMVGVGLPNVLSFGGLLKLTRYLGGGINIGLIPTIRVSYYGDATLSYQEYDAFGRIFPFGGGFFLGAGVGYEQVKGTMADKLDTSASVFPGFPQVANLNIPNPLLYESAGTVKTMVLTPQIGYFCTTSIGFSIGLDIGAQVPIAPSEIKFASQLTLPANTPQLVADNIRSQLIEPNDEKVRSTLKTIGQTLLPTVNIRVGWLL